MKSKHKKIVLFILVIFFTLNIFTNNQLCCEKSDKGSTFDLFYKPKPIENKAHFYDPFTAGIELVDERKYSGHYHIAIGFSKLKKFNKAIEHIEKIENIRNRDECSNKAISFMLEDNKFDKVERTISMIDSEDIKESQNFKLILAKLRYLHDYSEAKNYIKETDNTFRANKIISAIFNDLLKEDLYEKAIEFFKENRYDEENYPGGLSEKFPIEFYIDKDDVEGLLNFYQSAKVGLNDDILLNIIRKGVEKDKIELVNILVDDLSEEGLDELKLQAARNYFKDKNYEIVEKIIHTLKLDKNRDQLYLRLAEVYIRQNNLEVAECYSDSIQTDSYKDLFYFRLGSAYIKEDNEIEADKALKKINPESYNYEYLLRELAVWYYINERNVDFEKALAKLSKQDNLNRVYDNIIPFIIKRKQYNELESQLNKISNEKIYVNFVCKAIHCFNNYHEFQKSYEYCDKISNPKRRDSMLRSIKNAEERFNKKNPKK